jgi:hypothetical protein
MDWDKAKLAQLTAAHKQAYDNKQERFVFEGHELFNLKGVLE